MKSAAVSDVGRVRHENEDAFTVIERPGFAFYAVADGIGGGPAGGEAARMACEVFQQQLAAREHIDAPVITDVIKEANRAIHAHSMTDPALAGMGTTVVTLAFTRDRMYAANVGDSRAYCIRGGVVTRLTDDHTLGAELVRAGALPGGSLPPAAPVANILTRSLGPEAEAEVDCWVTVNGPEKGDVYLLCSDGLSSNVPESEIVSILLAAKNLDQFAEALVARANEHGGSDNITVVALRVEEGFPRPLALPSTGRAAPGEARITPRAEAPARDFARVSAVILSAVALVFAGVLIGRSTLSPADHSSLSTALLDSSLQGPDLDSLLREAHERGSLGAVPKEREAELPLSERELREALTETRSNLEAATRRLSLWYARYQLIESRDPIDLAAEVSVAHESVAKARTTYEGVQMRYLRAAEDLVYNPLDHTRETEVSALAQEREQRAAALREEVRRAVENEANLALASVLALSQRRDRIQLKLAGLDETSAGSE